MGHGRRGLGRAGFLLSSVPATAVVTLRPRPYVTPNGWASSVAVLSCRAQSTLKPPARGCFSANLKRSRPTLCGDGPHRDTIEPLRTMLDIVTDVRVHLDAFIAEQQDMGVCDAIEKSELG